jgi:pimeloyl-ACP methyl ester carboxylesterase
LYDRAVRGLVLIALLAAGCFGVPIHAKTKQKPPPEGWRIPHVWVDVPAGDDTTLRGIWADRDGPGVVLLYGSAMGIRGVIQFIEILHDGGYAVLCCDYRGTGYSSGKWWTSRHLDDDATALVRWVQAKKGGPGGVVGVSIGAVAATKLVWAENPPGAVVLDRPVDPRTVIKRFIAGSLGGFGGFVATLLVHPKCDVDLRGSLRDAKTPTLLVLPEYDFIFPPEDVAYAVAEKAPCVETVVAGGGHLSSHLVAPVFWRQVVLDFLDKHLRPGQPPVKAGRELPPDPVRVLSFGLEGRKLSVELDEPLPGRPIEILAMGPRMNLLIKVEEPRPRMTFEIDGSRAKRLRPLFGVRVVPDGFRTTTGTRRATLAPIPPRTVPPRTVPGSR